MTNAGKPVTQRQLRVGEMIKQSLSMIFLKDEAKIPSINTKEITVTEVRMSPDLKTAKVFVLPLGGKNSEEIIGKLKEFSFRKTAEFSAPSATSAIASFIWYVKQAVTFAVATKGTVKPG